MVIFQVFGLKVRLGFESKFSFLFSSDGYLSKFIEKNVLLSYVFRKFSVDHKKFNSQSNKAIL